jgi:hypothetical protein
MGGNSPHDTVIGHVLGDDGSSGDDGMSAYGHSWQDDSIGANPYVITDDNRFRGYPLLVNPQGGVLEIMIQCGDRNALGKVHMTAYRHRTDHRAVDADTGVVANHHIAYGIVDAAV